MDLAGIVEEVGEGVSDFKKGDEVFAMAAGIGKLQGSLAEYVTLDGDFLAKKPKNITMKEAAALPLIFITAWEGLVDRAQIKAGDAVLVHGGAGGVGHMAVQIAIAFGATVYATGKTSHQKTIEDFGATFIDFEKASVDDYVKLHTQGQGFDIVYDTVGGETLDKSFLAARTYYGHVVSCLGWGMHKLAPLSFRGATYSGVFTLLPILTGKHRKHHGKILTHAARLVDEGKIKTIVDPNDFTLERANEAYALMKARLNNGKVVVQISGS